MRSYLDFIAGAELFCRVDTMITTGDSEYPGTAIEVRNEAGEELFHIVVDANGTQQILFFARESNYRLPLGELEEIVARAKKIVRVAGES